MCYSHGTDNDDIEHDIKNLFVPCNVLVQHWVVETGNAIM